MSDESRPPQRGPEEHPLLRLEALAAKLRAPEGGCPWDQTQTIQSLMPYVLEETYEVLDAVHQGDDAAFREEMGDLFFLLFLMLQVAREEGRGNIEEVVTLIVEKMVRRHPHVFSQANDISYDRAMVQWEEIKREEGRKEDVSALNEVGETMPALLLAYRLQQKASAVGFDWPAPEPVMDKVEEETRELREALDSGDREKARAELGDLLFACVNLSRFLDGEPEALLRSTVRKFRRRFHFIEEALARQGRRPEGSTLEEMDRLWEESKKTGGSR